VDGTKIVIFPSCLHDVYGIVISIDPKSAQTEPGVFIPKAANPTHHTRLSQNKDNTDITTVFTDSISTSQTNLVLPPPRAQ
jgi:hypothetical protein